ncbi:AMIN-like domain-containing (lipo)protein [Actinoplanes sichuanensis]|uniref:AMIN-like domain-containing protein n=1 Tax=Actinoplanes sichuanensis TaxID=512349 RepID=A0ABW4AAD8_9ACTN|nr:hypothetical protein [Actinoplanes sichuanensis]
MSLSPRSRRRVLPAVLALAVLALPAGCGAATDAGPRSTSTPPTSPVHSIPPAVATAPTTRPPVATASWTTDPVTVRRSPAVPPVPVLTGIRYVAHPAEGYDRIVFDISGPAPGYAARYVDEVRADPSDQVVTVPGRAHLLLVFTPAQAHRDDGTVTVTGTRRLDLPMLRSYAVVGDFEGHVSIALGLDDVVGYRIGEASGRIYVDVAA